MTDAPATAIPMKSIHSVSNGYAPDLGPRSIPITLTFAAAGTQELDLLQEALNNGIALIQTVWIYNPTANPVTIVFPATQYTVVAPPNSIGFYPVVATPPFRHSVTVGAAQSFTYSLLNVPMAYAVWSTLFSPGGGGAGGALATYADRSGTITLGGTSQQLMAANASRRGMFVQNVSVGDLWINFTVAAVINQPSIRIGPGENITITAPDVSGAVVNIIGATTGQAFDAREW